MRKGIFFLSLVLLNLFWPRYQAYAGMKETLPLVEVHSTRLNVKVKDIPLVIVLQEIARQGEIKVYGAGGLEKEKISADITDMTVQEGLAKMLAGYNVAYIYSQGERDNGLSSSQRLAEIWVFSNEGVESTGHRNAEEETNFLQLAGTGMESHDRSNDKEGILESLGERGDPAAIPVLLNFLKDRDQAVRLRALDILSNFGTLVPVERLAEIAIGHEDPDTRIGALQILEGNEQGKEVIREALKDNNPSVQSVAKDILGIVEDEGLNMMEEQQGEDSSEDNPVESGSEE